MKYLSHEEIALGMGPLGYMADRETDGGMSLAPKGFETAVIRARDPFVDCEPCYQSEAGSHTQIKEDYVYNLQSLVERVMIENEFDVWRTQLADAREAAMLEEWFASSESEDREQ